MCGLQGVTARSRLDLLASFPTGVRSGLNYALARRDLSRGRNPELRCRFFRMNASTLFENLLNLLEFSHLLSFCARKKERMTDPSAKKHVYRKKKRRLLRPQGAQPFWFLHSLTSETNRGWYRHRDRSRTRALLQQRRHLRKSRVDLVEPGRKSSGTCRQILFHL